MNPKETRQPHALELFAGGVPPYSSLSSAFYRLNRIIEMIPDELEDGKPIMSWTADLCLIAVVAHFEAFCKDLFASAVNICPSVLEDFAVRRPDQSIPLVDLFQVDLRMERHLGFLAAERMDFGDPKKVNSAFFDLLGISALSKDRIQKVHELLALRNLLVHHGGVYTSAFARQHKLPRTEVYELFHQGPAIYAADVLKWMDVVGKIAKDVTRASHQALCAWIRKAGAELKPFQRRALDYLTADVDSGSDDVAKDIEADFKEPNTPSQPIAGKPGSS